MTYQVSSCVGPMICLAIVINSWNSKNNRMNEIVVRCFYYLVGYLLSLLLFFLLTKTSLDSSYITPTVNSTNLVLTILNNYKRYITDTIHFSHITWLVTSILVIVTYIICTSIKSKQSVMIAFIVNFFGTTLLFLSSFGVYPALSEPLFHPRAMYGIGIFLFLLILITIDNVGKKGAIPGLVLSYLFFAFTFIYGNCLSIQKEFTDFINDSIVHDLISIDEYDREEVKNIQFEGVIYYTDTLEREIRDYPIIKHLIPPIFKSDYYWSEYQFYHCYNLTRVKKDTSIKLSGLNLPLLKQNAFYTIYGENNNFLISFK